MDFLKNTYYSPTYHIATKGRTDFVIHTGKDASHPVSVPFEAKKLSNTEMVSISDLNRKAMHEIILYYLRERIEHQNNDIKSPCRFGILSANKPDRSLQKSSA